MGKCKFLDTWLEKTDDDGNKIEAWGKKQDNNLYCLVCQNLICTEKGFYAIRHHYQTEKHKKNFKLKMGSSQLQLSLKESTDSVASGSSTIRSVHLFNSKEAALAAELIWSMKIVACNMSIESCNGIADVFKAMFKGSVPDQFSLSPTKVGYLITDALAPFFREEFLSEVQRNYFSIQYDETTNNAGKKELQILVRFWSESKREVCTRHLETMYMGHATADDLSKNILSAIDRANLPLCKLLMLGSDGPNVNKKTHRLINEEVKLVRTKGLIDVGFCNIHIMHNAFQKGLEELGCDASDLIISLYSYFRDWPARWEDFSRIQDLKNLPNLHFIKHVSSRWLTLQPAASRVLQQWDAVVEYFLKYVPSKQTKLMGALSYKKIITLLKKKSIRAELMFICTSSALFTKFTGFFQKDEPLIHLMHAKVREVLLTIMGRVCKENIVTTFNEEDCQNVFTVENLINVRDFFFNDELSSCLASLTTAERYSFAVLARKHYVAAGNYILQKKIFSGNSLLKALGCLDPAKIKNSESVQSIVQIAKAMPFEIDIDHIIDEWKLLQLEVQECSGVIDGRIRIDHYWGEILKMKGQAKLKYSNLDKVIKAALTLIHGSADIERSFSRSARIMTEDRASMSVRMLNARLTVSDALKQYDNKPELVPLPKRLVNLASVAYKSYNNYLEQERRRIEEEEKKAKEAENVKAAAEESNLNLQKSKQDIKSLAAELKVAREDEIVQNKVSDKLLEEANQRLKKALDKGDFAEAKIAQTMIEGVMKSKEETQNKRKHVTKIEEKLERKKDSLITSFFSKRQRKE